MLDVHPEGHPGDDDDEDGGDVGLNQVEPNTSLQLKSRSQAAVVTCKTFVSGAMFKRISF